MADRPIVRDGVADTGAGLDHGSTAPYPGTPRWVKVSGIIVLVLVLLVAGVMGVGGGEHGPARHLGSGNAVATQHP